MKFLDDSAFGNLDINIVPVFAAAVFLAAFLPVSGFIFSDMAKIGQGIQAVVHHEDHIAAVPAVTAVGSACRHIFFTPERNVPVAALPASYINFRSVCKHSILLFIESVKSFVS